VVNHSGEITEARRVLGRQLAELRQAAGYNQHEFAPLTCYGRSTIANVETGRQQVPRAFWARCDEALGTEGALVTGFDRITAMVQERRRDAVRAALRRGAPPDELPECFSVESHKFVPAYVGPEAAQRLAEHPSFSRHRHGWLESYVLPVETGEGRGNLYVFACGVAVFHLCEERSFPDVTSLALWRWDSYRSALVWTSEDLSRRLASVGRPSVSSDYVLSLYWLQRPGWPEADLDTALRLISVPSVLVDREPRPRRVQDADAAERELFRSGFSHPDLLPFGVQGISLGYASWSGVSYYPRDRDRALSRADLVSCELTVQALWCYCHHILTEVEEGRNPVAPSEYGLQFVRAARLRLTAARAQETSQYRLLRDAILSTSGLQPRLDATQEILREAQLAGGRILR
jgi:hypothetical protein